MDVLGDDDFANQVDLMIVMGTALAVGPFNSVVGKVKCPAVLINLQNTAESGYEFDDAYEWPSRLWLEGKCDEVIREICEYCGWTDDLNQRVLKFSTKS
jgi:NAD-dependent histone deacetylase SIR2